MHKNTIKSSARKSIVFIVNPISGGNNKKDISEAINNEIDSNIFDIRILFTEYVGHGGEISKKLVDEGCNIIVAVGGDGTINEIASQMINSESTLGIIPRGSGNGLARHLGISRNTIKALKLINSANTTKIDTATVNNRPFISIAGVGFDAAVAEIFTQSKKRGFFSYFKIIAEQYHAYRPKKYILKLDDKEEITDKALFISFANSNQFGYNTSIAPNAKLNDGMLDVCIVQKPNIFEIPIIANLLLLKKIHLSPHVNIIPASKIIVKQSQNRAMNLDGEAIKMGKELKIEVKPLSLKLIIP
jgi:YegS/Rv2252/BmrU family lipid kinase